MGSLRRASKDKDVVGRFKPDGRCKKHPKHRQSPGVCSLCLTDKLSQLSAAASSSRSSSVSSSLSSYYSSSASSCASPTTLPFSLPKSGSSSVSFFLFSSKNGGVLKSRSMSLLPTRTRKESGDCNNKSRKKSGFWSKLLRPKTKRMNEIKANKPVHTRSLIQTAT